MGAGSLKKLYHQYCREAYKITPLEQIVESYLNDTCIDAKLLDHELVAGDKLDYLSPWELLDAWRKILIPLLIFKGKLQEEKKHLIIQEIKRLQTEVCWPEFQLLSAYQHLVDILLGCRPEKKNVFFQLEEGACPVEGGGHWSWGGVPHPAFHAELGTLWLLCAGLTGNQLFFEYAKRLVEWQLHTLDHDFSPFVGLYSHEGNVSESLLLINNYILFFAASRCMSRPDYAFIAKKILSKLNDIASKTNVEIPPYAVLMEKWFGEQYSSIEAQEMKLPTHFQDIKLGKAGNRSENSSAIGTLFGGGTGMGCCHFGDVQVVNFGPQHLPLGDCRGFGVEGGGQLLSEYIKSISITDTSFNIEGLARMASLPMPTTSLANFRQGQPSGIWLDSKLRYEAGEFSIHASFKGLFDHPIAFVFFVKANNCLIDGKQMVKPRSFQQYSGEVREVELQGNRGSLFLNEIQKQGLDFCQEMQVIPLGGGKNFWGADFLVAYMSTVGKHLGWRITRA